MNAVSQLEREWGTIASGELAAGFSRWRARERALQRFATPAQLLAFLGRASGLESDAPLLALLSLAPADPRAGRLLLQAILPALKAQSARIAHPQITHPQARREEIWELLLFHAWEAICCYPLATRRRRVAANLVLQVLHETTRELRRDRRVREASAAGELLRSLPAEGASLGPGVGEAAVLAAAAAGAITARDAELVLESRLEGTRLGPLARELGLSGAALYKRRRRAEQRLAQFLAAGGDVQETVLSDLISAETTRPRPRPPHRAEAARPRADAA